MFKRRCATYVTMELIVGSVDGDWTIQSERTESSGE